MNNKIKLEESAIKRLQELAGIDNNPIQETGADIATVAAGIAGVLATSGGIHALMAYLKAHNPKAYNALANIGTTAGDSIKGGTTSEF